MYLAFFMFSFDIYKFTILNQIKNYLWDAEIKKLKKEKYLKDLLENQDLQQTKAKKAAAKKEAAIKMNY